MLPQKKYTDILFLLLSATALFYIIYRAIYLSITHDEALTYFYHVSGPLDKIIAFDLPLRTNNHLLNTLLSKLFIGIFGLSEFVLRLPNVIGFGFFLFGIYNLLNLFLKNFWLVFAAVLIIFNPYLLDFFSLARGYGLAIGLLAPGIYFSLKYLLSKEQKYMTHQCIYFFFAVTANLSFLYPVLGVLTAQFILLLLFKNYIRKFFISAFATVLALGIVYYEPVRKMIKFKDLNFGGFEGFWQDTVKSLIESVNYDAVYFNFTSWFLQALILITVVTAIIGLWFAYRKKNIPFLFFFLVLIVTVFGIWLQHQLFGTPYVMGRFATYFILFFLLSLISLLTFLFENSNKPQRYSAFSAGIIIFFMATVHYLNTLNLQYTYDWHYDASTKKMMTDVAKMTQDEKLRLGGQWIFLPAIKYYKMVYQMDNLEFSDNRNFEISDFDLFYQLQQGQKEYDWFVLETTNVEEQNVIREYPVAKTILIKIN